MARTYRRPKVGRLFKIVFYSSSERSNTSFVTGRLYTPLGVWFVTTRTSPSLPGMTSLTRARGHLVGDVCSHFTQTISPTFKFGEVCRHLLRFWSWPRYSADQRFHRWRVRAWHRCHRRSRLIVRKEAGGSGEPPADRQLENVLASKPRCLHQNPEWPSVASNSSMPRLVQA